MLKLGHCLPFRGENQKWNFFMEKPKKLVLGGSGLKKPRKRKNMPKLGHYLPFEQKIQKWNFFVEKPKKLVLGGSGLKKPRKSKNMPKLGHYLAFEQKIRKWNFFVQKPKKLVFGGSGLKKTRKSKNMPKLGYYLPFEQKIQKWNFFLEKPKNLYFRGPNPKKVKITLFALLIVSKFIPSHFPSLVISFPWWGGGRNPHIDVGVPLSQNKLFPTTQVCTVFCQPLPQPKLKAHIDMQAYFNPTKRNMGEKTWGLIWLI